MNHRDRTESAINEFWCDCVYYWMWKYEESAMRAAIVKFLLGEQQ